MPPPLIYVIRCISLIFRPVSAELSCCKIRMSFLCAVRMLQVYCSMFIIMIVFMHTMANAGQCYLGFGECNVQHQPLYLFWWTFMHISSFMLFISMSFAFISMQLSCCLFRWTIVHHQPVCCFLVNVRKRSPPAFMLRFTYELYVHHRPVCCFLCT